MVLRRLLTSFALTLPVVTNEMRLDTLVALLDDLAAHPNKYHELADERRQFEEDE